MNNFTLLATISIPPQLRHLDSDPNQRTCQAWVQFAVDEDKFDTIRVNAWNSVADRLMAYPEGTCLLLEGSLSMNTVERKDGFKEKLAEMTVSRLFPIIEVKEPKPETSPEPAPEPAAVTPSPAPQEPATKKRPRTNAKEKVAS